MCLLVYFYKKRLFQSYLIWAPKLGMRKISLLHSKLT